MRSITQRSYCLHPGGIISLPATAYATIYPLLQGLYNKAEHVGRYTFQNFFTFNNRGFFSATGQFFKIVLAHKPVFTTMFRAINHFSYIPCNSGKISVVSCRQLIHKQVSHSIDRIGIPNLENILHFPVNSGKEISRPLKVIGIGSVGYFVGRVVGYKVKDCCLNMQYPYTNTAVTSSFSVYNFHRKVKQGLNHPDKQVITRGRFPKRTQFWEIKKPTERQALCFFPLTGFDTCNSVASVIQSTKPLHEAPASIQRDIAITRPIHSQGNVRLIPPQQKTNIKQFLNYQGVCVKISVVKSVVKPSEISLFSNVFTVCLGRSFDSYHPHHHSESPVNTGLLLFINLNRSKNRSNL